jgi:hypothetical protein
VSSESLTQTWFIKWTWINYRKYPELRLGFAVPNGAWTKNIMMAMKLKREGMRPGVPDWMLPVRSRQYIGLAIEFKYGKNKLTKEQTIYQALLREQGWQVETCWDWKVAAGIVEEYLK